MADEHVMAGTHAIGAPGYETENHFAAIRKHEGVEAERRARAAAAGLPYVPEHTGADRFEQMLALISVPEAAKARYTAIVAATDEAKRATTEAVAARQTLDEHEREHRQKLDDASDQHARHLARQQTQHEETCGQRERKLAQREAAMRESEDRLKAAIEAADQARADFERRLDALNKAAAA